MIKRIQQNARMSQAVEYNGCFETAGQVANNPSAGIAEQTQQILESIDSLLSAVGGTKNDLTRVQIWLSNIQYFDEMNVVYERWLEGFEKPVRACVESRLAGAEYLIEVQAFGYISSR
ncbi:RidA family protein [Burkholderia sp. BKH01]|uniref:RidA family protein n=1 Tax=Burkholderia sp. BKH01 TaxID=2769262 RepID=UPI0021DF47B9|nr:RidA family protein [Burkholderia sp. BKH01]MCU9952032.1 RidA family protein [Burkholderia sp. BKH01]